MAVYEFFTSRNNAANVATFVGQAGRLFYDGSNGVIKLSDGVTPGGTFIPYNIATTTTIGGIKAGPGANVAPDGTLTIDTAGLPLGIGNLQVTDNILSSVNSDADVIIASNGTGNVELRGNIHFHTTSNPTSTPFFTANNDGQITILVPNTDPLAGAVKIVGSTTGRVSPPLNTGVMLQVTGNNDDASRIYNDAIGNFAAFVGRRINGNLTVPTRVVAGDEIIRISSTGHDGNSVSGAGSARILYQAKENYTTGARGTNLSIWTTAIGSTTLIKTATFDRETGLTVNGSLNVSGNIVGNATTTVATIGTANVTTLNVSGNATVSGVLSTQNVVSVGSDITVTGNIKYDGNANNFTVTQGAGATKSVPVTGNGRSGQITTNGASIAKNEAVTFTLNNNYITSARDVGVVCIASGATPNSYSVAVTAMNAVSRYANITITNNGTGALTDTMVINFALISVA